MSQQRIEKWVKRLVAKPLSLALFGAWLGGCYIVGAARNGTARLRQRWARRSLDAVGTK